MISSPLTTLLTMRPSHRPTELPVGGRASWMPARLFASGEQGAWYDPSDMSTLYQDSAGTTPVTAVGQPVGLMLDKRLGLVRGAELVTNGAFNVDLAVWSNGAGAFVWVNGSAVSTGLSGDLGVEGGVVGKTYSCTFTISSITGLGLYMSLAGVDSGYYTNGTHSRIVTCTATTKFVRVRVFSGSGGTIDNISVRELPGAHATQPTTTARLLYQASPACVVSDGVDDSHTTTFSASLGSACTVIRSVPSTGTTILTGQTIGASYSNTATHSGLIIINRALTAAETLAVTRWGNQRAGV